MYTQINHNFIKHIQQQSTMVKGLKFAKIKNGKDYKKN